MEVLKSNHFLEPLKNIIEGDLLLDETTRRLYATDASSYRQVPLAVLYPHNDEDIKRSIAFAKTHNLSIIPRAAGTSLAGQVVGSGIVIDISRNYSKIIAVSKEKKWVWVQPGVIRDELNIYLKPFGLMFGPETSTSNRAMIGGMVGNNSCGANSIIYGSTRDYLLEVKTILSDGTEASFSSLSKKDFKRKCMLPSDSLEGNIYRDIDAILGDKHTRSRIKKHYPHPEILRRNTGYALDLLMDADTFEKGKPLFNFCKLIAGSEGTLAFITAIKIALVPLPPKEVRLICVHFDTVYNSLKATKIALKYNPSAVELIDHYIIDRAQTNLLQKRNCLFIIKGKPKAILAIELRRSLKEQIVDDTTTLIKELKENKLGYHYPILQDQDTDKFWSLRKAGLGLLSNILGDSKPVPVIEDTAVRVQDLPDYILALNKQLEKYAISCVHYAHAGAGELHLRPILNLKTKKGNALFRVVLAEVSDLVKKYKGSLSGEHGDGRLRGEFIPFMIGEENYKTLKSVKKSWDPTAVFNAGKIVDTPPMNNSLRFTPGSRTPLYDTLFDFSDTAGIIRAAEQCNGSGDCRKTVLTGGTMCPSYMVTRNEKHTTRARANIFREIAGRSELNPFESEQIKDVFDLCLACKGCKAECPSNVDITKIKAEFLFQYQKKKGISLRTRLISNFILLNKLGMIAPWLYSLIVNGMFSVFFKKLVGFAEERSMPKLNKQTFQSWFIQNKPTNFGVVQKKPIKGRAYILSDEFTNYNDLEIGKTVVKLLTKLGYSLEIAGVEDTGRGLFSKGLLSKAKKLVDKNINVLVHKISAEEPLIGIEPSAILSFRDEYLYLATDKIAAKKLAPHCLLIEEFFEKEINKKNITSKSFFSSPTRIKYHGHCHQKAISSLVPLKKMLELIPKAQVELIPSGCCGMAGSFGYEKEHYQLSMQIGELVLFPLIRAMGEKDSIVASGISCRHQINDGTKRRAYHPAEILYTLIK